MRIVCTFTVLFLHIADSALSGIGQQTPLKYSTINMPNDLDSYVIATPGRKNCFPSKEEQSAGSIHAPGTDDCGVAPEEIPTEISSLLSPEDNVTQCVDRPLKQNNCGKLDDNDNTTTLLILPEARV